jgi:hypothetical protein
MNNNNNIMGIIPLGGNATRMKHIPKFLLPCKINYTLLENTIDIFYNNNIVNITAGSSELNYTLLNNYTNINKIIVKTDTMAETVTKIINNKYYKNILIMPDTYITINNELIQLIKMLDIYDISVLVWKIKDYQIGNVGQCKIINNEVVDIIDKDKNCNYEYFWGVIGWSSKLNSIIDPKWNTIGDLIKTAIKLDIKVGAIIMNTNYYDCGTFDEYFKMIKKET